jgi:DNA polymerase-3 subunit chi
MPEVDFYILSTAGEKPLLLYACGIAEQAWKRGQHVHVQLGSQEQAQQFDDLLWTFRQDSFVPHELEGAAESASGRAVSLGFSATLPTQCGLVVNLSEQVPDGFAHCQRIAELVSPDDEYRQRARARYRDYREAGCTLSNHNV